VLTTQQQTYKFSYTEVGLWLLLLFGRRVAIVVAVFLVCCDDDCCQIKLATATDYVVPLSRFWMRNFDNIPGVVYLVR
jgi:hypothetical protein